MPNSRKSLGSAGENLALKHLLALGYTLIERNYRFKGGEIDLIMRDGINLVFVEVRSKTSTERGTPLETINYKKRRQIIRCASYYLMAKGLNDSEYCRFDAVGITFNKDGSAEIEHIINAFTT